MNYKIKSNLKLGIIIPCFNNQDTLKACLLSVESFKKQWGGQLYCVLIDDCSSDDSLSIASDFQRSKVLDLVLSNSVNLGVSASRNLGIKSCINTDFITFLDADDQIIFPKIPIADNYKKYDLIFYNYLDKNGLEENKFSFPIKKGELTYQDINPYLKLYLMKPNKHGLLVTSWAKLFKTKMLIDNNLFFNPRLKLFEDVDFNCRALMHVNVGFYVNDTLYVHNIPNGINRLKTSTFGTNGSIRHMFGFTTALSSLRKTMLYKLNSKNEINPMILQCIGAYTIITLIRASLRIDSIKCFIQTTNEIKKILSKKIFLISIKAYKPKLSGGDTLIPRLLRWKLYAVGTYFALMKAKERYIK